MEHLAILFFATFSAALMGVVPPGLINMTAAKVSLTKGKVNGILFASGASATVVAQAYVAVLISKYLYNNPFIIDILLKIALVVFGFFTVYFFIVARKKKEKKIKEVDVSKRGSFLKGMLLALVNLLPIPYFCGLNAAWKVSGWIKFEVWDVLVFIIAAGSGTFAMLYMYVVYFDKLQAKSDRFSRYSDYVLSVLMLILVIITFIRIFYGE
ncbi:lysine transporter LysE [Zhouia spongiae]|uniref:Lysine transporter LysE n=1 Tax=Zhouia spongiae TaxID=2202721 RepID=A0ABY3YUA9_9FLAO|nr:LysE family transporter [Zhouia spongiae]UNZ00114.1 lysine transporter LysE [Zhouia spongiae]